MIQLRIKKQPADDAADGGDQMEQSVINKFREWKELAVEDPDLVRELDEIGSDEEAVIERFSTDLDFGTAGLRGVLGAGTIRMNLYTVRRAAQAMSNVLLRKGPCPVVAIACDSRNKSRLFAETAATVFSSNGIKVYLFDKIAPTPMLSYAVRYYGCDAGVMITASHNPAEYNGFKAYGPDGCQLDAGAAREVFEEMQKIDPFRDVLTQPFELALETGLISAVAERMKERYFEEVRALCLRPNAIREAKLRVAFTPLCGAGAGPVTGALSEAGAVLDCVEEQMEPDGDFTTCPYPNPETPQALSLGLARMERNGDDLLIATDPDADRVGVAIPGPAGARIFTGNEIGVLLLDYLARGRREAGTLPERPVAVRSVVSTPLFDAVAREYGIEPVIVLTGFKYIGGVLRRLEEAGETGRFVFGFEESCGYLAGGYVRDKDAVSASLLIAEMAAYHKLRGKTLAGALDEIGRRHGFWLTETESIAFSGPDGMRRMSLLMDRLFAGRQETLGNEKVVERCDFREGVRWTPDGEAGLDFPKSEIFSLKTSAGSEAIIRPSGTEPKLKAYYRAVSSDPAGAARALEALKTGVKALLGQE